MMPSISIFLVNSKRGFRFSSLSQYLKNRESVFSEQIDTYLIRTDVCMNESMVANPVSTMYFWLVDNWIPSWTQVIVGRGKAST